MAVCYLDALKRSLKRREKRLKKEKLEMLQQASYRRKSLDDEILGCELSFVG